MIDNRVKPHCLIFGKILNLDFENNSEIKKFIKKHLDGYSYDFYDSIDFKKKKTNRKYIEDITPLLEDNDMLFIKSSMNTGKTYGLKNVFKNYEKKLLVSFRISLEKKYMNDFKDFGFEFYKDCNKKKGFIRDIDNLVCQINSLYKVIGQYDLIVLDEIVYTLDMIFGFCDKKEAVWKALFNLIKCCKKVIIMDALLNTHIINLFKEYKQKHFLLVNEFKPFEGRKYYFNKYHKQSFILDLQDTLSKGEKVFFPTGSKKLGDEVKDVLKDDFKVKIASKKTFVPPEEWKNYDLFGTTPTNTAGVSCEDEFDKCIGYCNSYSSCNAENYSQIIHRVRNLKSKDFTFYFRDECRGFNPLTINDIQKYIKTKDDITLSMSLKINNGTGKIIKDKFYHYFVNYLQRLHFSRVYYREVLSCILDMMGYKDGLFIEIKKFSLDEFNIINDKLIDCSEKRKDLDIQGVLNATNIDCNQVELLTVQSKNRVLTDDEEYSLRKFFIKQTYNIDDTLLSNELINDLETKQKQFRQLNMTITHNLTTIITDKTHENENNNINRLMDKKNVEKIIAANKILDAVGFDSPFDTKTIKIDYHSLFNKIKEYSYEIQCLFDCKAFDWDKMDINNSKNKTKLLRFVNSRIDSVFGLKLKSKRKQDGGTRIILHSLQGLEVYDKHNIKFEQKYTPLLPCSRENGLHKIELPRDIM